MKFFNQRIRHVQKLGNGFSRVTYLDPILGGLFVGRFNKKELKMLLKTEKDLLDGLHVSKSDLAKYGLSYTCEDVLPHIEKDLRKRGEELGQPEKMEEYINTMKYVIKRKKELTK